MAPDVLFVPGAHGVHEDAASPEKEPGRHDAHTLASVPPMLGLLVPGVHAVHTVLRVADEKVPEAHVTHAVALEELNVPGPQGSHVATLVAPTTALAVPASQPSHVARSVDT